MDKSTTEPWRTFTEASLPPSKSDASKRKRWNTIPIPNPKTPNKAAKIKARRSITPKVTLEIRPTMKDRKNPTHTGIIMKLGLVIESSITHFKTKNL